MSCSNVKESSYAEGLKKYTFINPHYIAFQNFPCHHIISRPEHTKKRGYPH